MRKDDYRFWYRYWRDKPRTRKIHMLVCISVKAEKVLVNPRTPTAHQADRCRIKVIAVDREKILLAFPHRDSLITLKRTYSAAKFGGVRCWIQCPKCDSRSRYMYVIEQRVVCRRCAGLKYRSQSMTKLDRYWNALAKLIRRHPWLDGQAKKPARIGNERAEVLWQRFISYQFGIEDEYLRRLA
jgi:hypothetical protein